MRFDILTLFPEMLEQPLHSSILQRAQDKGCLAVYLHNIRNEASDKHKTVDDTPYGGGAGMLLKVDVVASALKKVLSQPEVSAIPSEQRRVLLLSAAGQTFTQPLAHYLAQHYQQVTLICGHYEGIDHRILSLVDGELSIGNFVVTGGELPALVIIDAVTRLLPGVITQESPEEESFSLQDEHGKALVEYPHYTRPLEFEGQKVPDVLLSGNHAAIKTWRLTQAKQRTEDLKNHDSETI